MRARSAEYYRSTIETNLESTMPVCDTEDAKRAARLWPTNRGHVQTRSVPLAQGDEGTMAIVPPPSPEGGGGAEIPTPD